MIWCSIIPITIPRRNFSITNHFDFVEVVLLHPWSSLVQEASTVNSQTVIENCILIVFLGTIFITMSHLRWEYSIRLLLPYEELCPISCYSVLLTHTTGMVGLEPTTCALTERRSTSWATSHRILRSRYPDFNIRCKHHFCHKDLIAF